MLLMQKLDLYAAKMIYYASLFAYMFCKGHCKALFESHGILAFTRVNILQMINFGKRNISLFNTNSEYQDTELEATAVAMPSPSP